MFLELYSSCPLINLASNLYVLRDDSEVDTTNACDNSTNADNGLDNVVFFHQTQWQRHMLAKYGTHVCLMDSTYNTSVYEMPLFALCVKTNSGFVYVASALVLSESADTFASVLQRVKQYNPDWHPRCFVTDFNEAQISATERVYPGYYFKFVFEQMIINNKPFRTQWNIMPCLNHNIYLHSCSYAA